VKVDDNSALVVGNFWPTAQVSPNLLIKYCSNDILLNYIVRLMTILYKGGN
jgi:hypothetical protein